MSDMQIQPSMMGGEIQALAPAEFARRLSDMKIKLELTRQFFKEVMVKDVDYGIIPGTDKPSLLKSGSESLLEFYNYAGVIKEREEKKDYATGFYDVTLTVQIVDKATGRIVGEGVGSANVYETRYHYRWGYKNEIPTGMDVSALKTRRFTSKKNGQEYTQYRIENDDLFSLWNTVLKMAKKRALVDATLQVTRSSGIFTQDLEDMEDWIKGESEASEAAASQPKAPVTPPPAPPRVTKPAPEAKPQGQANTGSQQPTAGKIDWTTFWSWCRGRNASKEQVHAEAQSFFNVGDLKSMTAIPNLSQESLDEFKTYLETIFPEPVQ